jgi:hypothetical protein
VEELKMRRLLIFFVLSALTLLLVSCEESKRVNKTTNTEGTEEVDKMTDGNVDEPEIIDEKTDINDLVTIKEAVNREDVAPNGDTVRYIYEVPIINIEKPGAQKINNMFLDLEKDMERRIGDGQNLTIYIKSRAFLNDEILSIVMEIDKPGPGGIYAVNYDMKNDKEINTRELLDRYNFDSQKLITEINRQVTINEGKPEEEQDFFSIDYFVDTIVTNTYQPNEVLEKMEEVKSLTKVEKERYVIENIDKIKAYLNDGGKFVFVHTAELKDEELVVE